MKSPYDDIIHLPHHVSQNHPQMPMLDRAAQFAPFAALTGYEAAVGETARLTAERRELDAQEAEELNRRLADLAVRLKDRPGAAVGCFIPDDISAERLPFQMPFCIPAETPFHGALSLLRDRKATISSPTCRNPSAGACRR